MAAAAVRPVDLDPVEGIVLVTAHVNDAELRSRWQCSAFPRPHAWPKRHDPATRLIARPGVSRPGLPHPVLHWIIDGCSSRAVIVRR